MARIVKVVEMVDGRGCMRKWGGYNFLRLVECEEGQRG